MAEDVESDCPNNARLFRIALFNDLENIAESVSEDEFLKLLTIFKSNPNTGRKLHKAMIKELYNGMTNDADDILKEGGLREALTKIAKLSEENTATSVNEQLWRPPGDVTSHLRSLDARKITEAMEQLEKRVNEMEKENDSLMKTIAESRSRICSTSDNVTRILDGAPLALQRLQKKYDRLATCLNTLESE